MTNRLSSVGDAPRKAESSGLALPQVQTEGGTEEGWLLMRAGLLSRGSTCVQGEGDWLDMYLGLLRLWELEN
jgi:hypothetical protein